MDLRALLGLRSRERRPASTGIDALIADGELERAEGQIRTRLLANPDSLGYRLKLADLLARRKKPALAAVEYMALAEAHARKESFDPAIRMVRKALDLSPGNLDMNRRLVQLEHLRHAIAKRAVIFDCLEHGERPPGSTRGLSASRMLAFWPEIVSSALVQELPAEQLGALFSSVEPIRMGYRMAVMRQGQIIARGHVLVSGAIEAAVPGPGGGQVPLLVLEPGAIFGDACLLDNAECPANYYAMGNETTVLRITKRALDALLASDLVARDLVDALRRLGSDARVHALARDLD